MKDSMKKLSRMAALGLCICMLSVTALAETEQTGTDTQSSATRQENQLQPGRGQGMPGNGMLGMQTPPSGERRMDGMMQQGGNRGMQDMRRRASGNGQASGTPAQGTQETGEQPVPPSGQDGERPELPPDMNGTQGMPDSGNPPEMPANGEQTAQNGETPPELPADGALPELPADANGEQAAQNGETPPEMPADGERPELPAGAGGDRPEPPAGGRGGQPGGMPGGMDAPESYQAANTLTESTTGGTYTSENSDENAVLVQSSTLTLDGFSVEKTGSSDGESADFYGINAAVLATDGASLTLENAQITSDGTHANGIFSYGQGTTVHVSDTQITTSGNHSGGLMTTGGATLNAENVNVSTSGNSSAAIRSDRGGGTMQVTGGTYQTAGVGSPAIYSTADITVTDATLRASASEAVVIEGGNSVTLENVDITGSNTVLNGQSTYKTNVLIYQSMSGDAREGASEFTMTGGSMTAQTGAMFHVTNVTTSITLQDVDFTYAGDSQVFLDASSDSWGRSGSNGGHVTLNLVNQDITGAIVSDSASSVSVHMDADSTWTLSGDSYVTEFEGDLSQVDLNGYTLYVQGEAVTQ